MASGDRNKEAGGPPDLRGSAFRWGALLSAIRDQIPSMDSDVSLADGEEDEELFLYQRDQSNLIPDLTEELEDFSLEGSHLQETFSLMSHPQEIWNEYLGSSALQNERVPLSESRGNLLLDTGLSRCQTEEEPSQHAISSSEFFMNEQQFGEGISRVITEKVWDLKKEKNAPNSSSDTLPTMDISPLLMLDTGEKERRKLIETTILSKAPLRLPSDLGHPQPQNKNHLERMAEVKKETVVLAEHPQELTLFRFKDIEKWDLDKVLQKLEKQSKTTNWPGEAGSPSVSHETFRAVSQSRLMGKLEELSRKQSKTFFPHCQRRPPKLLYLDQCRGDARDDSLPALVRNDLSQIPAALLCVPEPPTVYIDLRDTIKQKLEPLADEAQSLSDSSSDDEEDIEVTAQNEEGRMNEFSQPSRKNCTGKCFLLQQLRNFRKKMSQLPAIAPDKRSRDLQKSDQTDLLNVRKRRSLKRRGQSLVMAGNLESNARNSLLTDCTKGAAKPSGEVQKETKEEACSELPPGSSSKKDARRSRYCMKKLEI
ncbi:dynein axonemal assembly factor 8 [Candoia aspera]|uniref:dynein axonemal assembly factor 8 n=1 Tax=Candoia aspera TaxID=51853 RepID=UPI002FD80A62